MKFLSSFGVAESFKVSVENRDQATSDGKDGLRTWNLLCMTNRSRLSVSLTLAFLTYTYLLLYSINEEYTYFSERLVYQQHTICIESSCQIKRALLWDVLDTFCFKCY